METEGKIKKDVLFKAHLRPLTNPRKQIWGFVYTFEKIV